MKKQTLAPDEEIKIPATCNVLWKQARNEIIARVLKNIPDKLQKAWQISDEQMRRVRANKIPPDLLVRVAKDCQSNKEFQHMMLSCAYSSLHLERHDVGNEKLAFWESALRLMVLIEKLEIKHAWLDSEEELSEFLSSQNLECKEQCDLAFAQLALADDIHYFSTKYQPDFYKKLNEHLSNLELSVESAEDYEKLQEQLEKIAKERRAYMREARLIRKNLKNLPKPQKLDENIFNGSLKSFISFLNGTSEDLISALKEAAQANLPKTFDAEFTLKLLQSTQPAIPENAMNMLQEELRELSERRLAQKTSQLMTNILPALLGEKKFDLNSYEEALNQDLAKDFGYKFIIKLNAGIYNIPQDFDKVSESRSEEWNAEPISEQSQEEDLSENSPVDTVEENVGTQEIEAEILLAAPDFSEEEGATEKAFQEVEEAETEEELLQQPSPVKLSADGFDFMEDELDIPPQPEKENNIEPEVLLPESMTLEQACALAEPGKQEDDGVKSEGPEIISTDPLERKFLQKKQEQGATKREASSRRPFNSISAENLTALKNKLQEKKSPEAGVSKEIRKDSEASRENSFRAFIDWLEESKENQEENHASIDPALQGWLIDERELEALLWLCRMELAKGLYPETLIELLYLGTQYTPDQEEISPRLLELTDQIIKDNEAFSEAEYLLLAAAILKPALMMPKEDMRTIISILSGKLAQYGLSSFFNALDGFISRRINLDPAIFTGESESRLREVRLERLRQETDNFLYRMRNSRMNFQPASQLRKYLFNPTGLLGEILENCRNGQTNNLGPFLAEYGDEKGMEKIIDTTAISHRNRLLEANTRKRLLSEVKQTISLIQSWQDYFQQSANGSNRSYPTEKFYELFESLPEELDRLQSTPEGRILAEQLQELAACPKKPLVRKSENPLTVLKFWPLRLPFFNLSSSTHQSCTALIQTIKEKKYKEKDYIAASLVTHLGAGRLNACKKFLTIYPDLNEAEPDMNVISSGILPAKGISLEKYFHIADSVWEDRFRDLIEEVKSDIVSCEFRGVLHTHQPARYVDQLNRIIAEVEDSGDRALGVKLLGDIRKDLLEMGEKEMEQIQEKIKDLEKRPDLSLECRQRLTQIRERHLKDKMLNLAWNELAEITDHLAFGQPLSDLPAELGVRNKVAHNFYDLLEQGPIKKSSHNITRLWDNASSAIKNPVIRGSLGANSVREIAKFLRWLGFYLDQNQQPEVKHSSPGPNYWRVVSMNMEISGPLPQWSSRKTRHIAAFGWNVRPDDINQLLKANFMDTEDCKTIICFNPLDLEARRRLMSLCAQRKIAPLIVDENLFNFLSDYDIPTRTEALFKICLAGAGIIPYVDVGGAVPKEMFFGREDDIRALLDSTGPCIVYGGRQLGKSALLQQIHNNPRQGVKTLLHSMSNSESSLLDAIRYESEQAGIVPPGSQKKNLSKYIKKWLDENRDWRILVLMDECDRVLDLDREKNFAESSILRDLMNETERRFKVVLTGLHSVQRFSQIPNQPFVHFTGALCIGPLSSTAAFELMTTPMSLLGVEFAKDQLVQVALNHCSYQPKLIQIFCMELLKGLGERRKTPFETIDEEGIQKIYGSYNLKKKIIECFDMTLNLDDRYLVIGYVLAINRHVRMDLQRLLQELKYYWPDAFAEKEGASFAEMLNTLRSLLHEMEGLGLVTRLDNEYMLRTPNVIDLLGGEDQILAKLDPYAKRPYKPVVSLEDLRLRDFEALVASQFNLLTEKSNSLHWISGSAALGLEQVESILKKYVEEENKYNSVHKLKLVKLSGANEHEVFQLLRKKYEALEGGMICYLSASEFPYTAAFMNMAERWLASLRTGRKYVKIICIVDPLTLHDFIRTGHAQKFSSTQIQLLPWSEDGLEQYYKENGRPGHAADQIMRESSGWTRLVGSYFSSTTAKRQLSYVDFWNGDHRIAKELIKFIANEMDGRLERASLQEDAAVMMEMLPTGLIQEVQEMLNWITTFHSLFILRDKGKHLVLDPLAKKVFLEEQV